MGPEQPAFGAQLVGDRRAGVRQRPAERRHRPSVADELVEEVDPTADGLECAVRLEHHVAEVERHVQLAEHVGGGDVRLRLELLAQVLERHRIARLDAEIHVRQPALVAQDAHRLLVDLVGPATDLERHPPGQLAAPDRLCDATAHAPPAPPGRHEVVVLEQEGDDARSRWRATISAADRLGPSQPAQRAARCLVERADAAEAAVPRAATAGEHRRRRQLLVLVVDVRPVRQRQLVEVLERHAVLVDTIVRSLSEPWHARPAESAATVAPRSRQPSNSTNVSSPS